MKRRGMAPTYAVTADNHETVLQPVSRLLDLAHIVALPLALEVARVIRTVQTADELARSRAGDYGLFDMVGERVVVQRRADTGHAVDVVRKRPCGDVDGLVICAVEKQGGGV